MLNNEKIKIIQIFVLSWTLFLQKDVSFQTHKHIKEESLLEQKAFKVKQLCNNDKSRKYQRLEDINFQ